MFTCIEEFIKKVFLSKNRCNNFVSKTWRVSFVISILFTFLSLSLSLFLSRFLPSNGFNRVVIHTARKKKRKKSVTHKVLPR